MTLYNSIGEIKLSRFIDAVTGNIEAVVRVGSPSGYNQEEISAKVSELMMQYIDACGGTGSGARLDRKRRMLFLEIRMNMLVACQALAKGGFHRDVIDALSVLGYSFREDECKKIEMRIDQLLKKCLYDIETASDEEVEGRNITRSDFSRERVMLMTYYRMYIDPDVYTAEEYAYIVNQYNSELESMRRRSAAMNK